MEGRSRAKGRAELSNLDFLDPTKARLLCSQLLQEGRDWNVPVLELKSGGHAVDELLKVW